MQGALAHSSRVHGNQRRQSLCWQQAGRSRGSPSSLPPAFAFSLFFFLFAFEISLEKLSIVFLPEKKCL